MSEKLKPCPFCGGTKLKIDVRDLGTRLKPNWWCDVVCFTCETKFSRVYNHKAEVFCENTFMYREMNKKQRTQFMKNFIISAWNTRAYEQEREE